MPDLNVTPLDPPAAAPPTLESSCGRCGGISSPPVRTLRLVRGTTSRTAFPEQTRCGPASGDATRSTSCSFYCYGCRDVFATDLVPRHTLGQAGLNGTSPPTFVCERCFSLSYWKCPGCSYAWHSGLVPFGQCRSRTCVSERARRPNLINPYSYRPAPRFQFTKEQSESIVKLGIDSDMVLNTYRFFGIELEVDDGGCESDHVRESGLSEMGEFYVKSDGSLNNGFEVVSHPGTIDFWLSHSWDFCPKLQKMGYHSFHTQTCGMHVHVSKLGFTEQDQTRLLYFIKKNQEFIYYVSRRERQYLERWAKPDGKPLKGLIRKVRESGQNDDRYTAVNLQPRNTMEFRIFRGTLNVPSIKNNLAFVDALLDFIKSPPVESIKDLTYQLFIEWLAKDQIKKYGDLGGRLLTWLSGFAPGYELEA